MCADIVDEYAERAEMKAIGGEPMSPFGAALFECFKSANPLDQINALGKLEQRILTNPATHDDMGKPL